MRTIKLKIMYEGTKYVGWQVQPNGVSIQQLIQDAILQMTGEAHDVIGASRTDAGVHALGQTAHFITSSSIVCDGFKGGLNAILPEDIVVLSAVEANDGFHARRDARRKRYCYRLIVSSERRPLAQNRCWHLRQMPDVAAMREAACILVGEHDFSSFRAAGCFSEHAVRRIDAIDIVERLLPEAALTGEGSFLDFNVEGNGFVRHMVRNIVGTLVDVGQGRFQASDVQTMLSACDREQAGRCAPACGLYLVDVIY